MKNIKKYLALISVSALLLSGCGAEKADIPFSDMTFDNNYEDVIGAHGEPEDEEKSYLGTSYCYPSDYMREDSEIRYTFDEDDKLAGITWLYETEDGEDIVSCYNELHAALTEKYGETEAATKDETQLSDIWRLPTGNITLAAVVSSDYNGIMYTYLSPSHSTPEK